MHVRADLPRRAALFPAILDGGVPCGGAGMEQSPRSPKLGNLTCVVQQTHLQALFTYACLGYATLNFVGFCDIAMCCHNRATLFWKRPNLT